MKTMTEEQIRTKINSSSYLRSLVPDTQSLSLELSKETYEDEYLIGKGDILNQLGMVVGNAVCDLLDSQPNYRHAKHLLLIGKLDLNLQISRQTIHSLVGVELTEGVVFTEEHRDIMLSLCLKNYYVTEYEVRCAIFNDDGTLKV